MSISIKKRAAVIKTFRYAVDPEEVDIINYYFAKRYLTTVAAPGKQGWRESAYFAEMLAQEDAIVTMLDRIRKRDGEKYFREARTYLRDVIDNVGERRPRARVKAHKTSECNH